MKIKLIDDVKDAPKFWSLRFALAAVILSAAEANLHRFDGLVEAGTFATAAMLVGIASGVARVISQANLK